MGDGTQLQIAGMASQNSVLADKIHGGLHDRSGKTEHPLEASPSILQLRISDCARSPASPTKVLL
jgi:hypothetical protein